MSEHEQGLQRRLDEANARIAVLERRERGVVVSINVPAPRNALQSISGWWHGGATAGARSRHMRVNY